MEIGKERYGFFKTRYFIKVDNYITYYYDKYFFIKAIITNIKELDLGIIDELELAEKANKIL